MILLLLSLSTSLFHFPFPLHFLSPFFFLLLPANNLLTSYVYCTRFEAKIFAKAKCRQTIFAYFPENLKMQPYLSHLNSDLTPCAAKAFYYCPAIISRRPRSQNKSKEPQLNSEKDSRIKRARSHVTLEKSS
jgi:hypothetical protein